MKKIISLAACLLFGTPAFAQPRPCPSPVIGCKVSHISTNTTTTVKSGAGFLHTVVISTKGASANTATIYDNTAGSGTIIAVIDTTGGTTAVLYDVGFSTGLTIVTATGTAADLVVSYN